MRLVYTTLFFYRFTFHAGENSPLPVTGESQDPKHFKNFDTQVRHDTRIWHDTAYVIAISNPMSIFLHF